MRRSVCLSLRFYKTGAEGCMAKSVDILAVVEESRYRRCRPLSKGATSCMSLSGVAARMEFGTAHLGEFLDRDRPPVCKEPRIRHVSALFRLRHRDSGQPLVQSLQDLGRNVHFGR